MPKCYSQQERDYIIKRLKEEATQCIAQYGIKKTTVDEIVKRVKIPKGTFYLFYQTKELLLFESILEIHDAINQKLTASLTTLDFSTLDIDTFTDLLYSFYQMIDEIPVLKMLAHEDMEILARKLPPEVIANHLTDDTTMLEQLFKGLARSKTSNIEVFSAAFRNIFLLVTEHEDFSDPNFQDSIKLLIRGLVIQILN